MSEIRACQECGMATLVDPWMLFESDTPLLCPACIVAWHDKKAKGGETDAGLQMPDLPREPA
jgi:hypothetical protein